MFMIIIMLLSSGVVGYFAFLFERAYELERTIVLREQQISQQLVQETLVHYAQAFFQEYQGDLKGFYNNDGVFIQRLFFNRPIDLKFTRVDDTGVLIEQVDAVNNSCQLARLSYKDDASVITWLC